MSATGIILAGWLVTSALAGLLVAGMVRSAEWSDSGSDGLGPWTTRGSCGDPEDPRASTVHGGCDADRAAVAELSPYVSTSTGRTIVNRPD